MVNNPKTSIGLIAFCNALKKGGLYILGHTIKGDFSSALPELKRQQTSWLRYVDAAKVKAFTDITIADSERLGARSLVLGSGLGGMRPNIVILGAYNIQSYRDRHLLSRSDFSFEESKSHFLPPSRESSRPRNLHLEAKLPDDTSRDEVPIEPCDYVAIIEDLLHLNKSVGVGFGFDTLETIEASQEEYRSYSRKHQRTPRKQRRYIDVWPIQVESPEDKSTEAAAAKSALSTYTMILQLATILNMVQQWRKQYRLRVVCFVEHPEDIPEEQKRVVTLLENLRIKAQLLVICLSGNDTTNVGVVGESFVSSYTAITQGLEGVNNLVDALVVETEWWQNTWKSKSCATKDKRHGSMDMLIPKAIKCATSRQTKHPGSTQTVAEAEDSQSSDNDTELDVPANATNRLSQSPFRVADIAPFDQFERRYSPPQLLTRFASVPNSVTMRVNLPAATSNAGDHYDSSLSSSDECYSSDDDTDEDQPSDTKMFSDFTSRLTEPVLGAIGFGKSKATDDLPTYQSTESGLGQLLNNWRANPPNMAETHVSIPSDSVQDYGSINRTETAPRAFPSVKPTEKKIEFNDLQSRAQHVIINELMRRVSPPERTAVIFSALPAPLNGTHKQEQDAVSYIENLEVLVQDLPPVMLIHANSLTVTMSL